MKSLISFILVLISTACLGQGNSFFPSYSGTVFPVVTTQAVTDITATTATGNGTVVQRGNPPFTERGSCWNTSTNPTVSNSRTSDGSAVGSFTSAMYPFTYGTTYYVRAYVITPIANYYGDNVSFVAGAIPTVTTTAITDIAATSATSGGDVTADGGGTVSARGVCWNTSTDPTTANDKTSDGTGTGSFASSITGLTTGTLYYVRAYATNGLGTGYGSNLTFTPSGPATVTTDNATNISTTSVTGGGNVTGDGGSTVTERGVCYKFSTGPTTANSKKTMGSGTGTFSASVTGLTADWTYYAKAYAINSAGTVYGSEVTWATACAAAPEVTGIVTINTPWASGTIKLRISVHSATATEVGVCYNTTGTPTTADSKTTGTNPIYPAGTFDVIISGLTPGATYHLKGYGINACGTAYSNEYDGAAGN